MNKYKLRTTAVRNITCSSALKNCPPRFLDGQIYRFRTYDTQCPKTVSIVLIEYILSALVEYSLSVSVELASFMQ